MRKTGGASRFIFALIASSLFARCWLLVEGERKPGSSTNWRGVGHHFDAEGIKVIEFAQSGLKPLIKFARRMGIEWHVLVDGDEAGKNMPRPCVAC
jgi:putative ATP-dependent endonuclease of OLD family